MSIRLPEINNVIVTGRLTRKPEARQVGDNCVVNGSIAVNKSYKNKQTGEWINDASFIDFSCWNKTAEYLEKYSDKGYAILVQGSIESKSWKTKDGDNRSSIFINCSSVKILEKKEDKEPNNELEDCPF